MLKHLRQGFALVFLVAVSCFNSIAGSLVLKNGQRIDFQGEYEIKGNLVLFPNAQGELFKLRVEKIDWEKTLAINPQNLEIGEDAKGEQAPEPKQRKRQSSRSEPVVLDNQSLQAFKKEKGRQHESYDVIEKTEESRRSSTFQTKDSAVQAHGKQVELNERFKKRLDHLRERIKEKRDLVRRERELLKHSMTYLVNYAYHEQRIEDLERDIKTLQEEVRLIKDEARRAGAKIR